MARTTNTTPGIFKKLAAGRGGFNLKWPSGGKHIEADLSRQVMVLARGGRARHIFHISSGAPATPTIRGKFPTYRKDPGKNSLGMIDSVYFIRGYATHGYHSVPTYPASHGCLRNPPANARFIYNWIDIGDVFYVYG
jgi:lipoprotein-anchoring transpeptidase ErfK/SrfK